MGRLFTAIRPAVGRQAASSKEIRSGLSARFCSGTAAYSAYAPPLCHWSPRSVSPNTSSPGWNSSTRRPTAVTTPADVRARHPLPRAPQARAHGAQDVRTTGDHVPDVGVDRRRAHPHQHLVVGHGRHRDLAHDEVVHGAVPVLHHRTHDRTVLARARGFG